MTTRASSRLREVKTIAEQQVPDSPSSKPDPPNKRRLQRSAVQENDGIPSTASPIPGPATRLTRSNSSLSGTTSIVKSEDGELSEETLRRLRIEADEHRSALQGTGSLRSSRRQVSKRTRDTQDYEHAGFVVEGSTDSPTEPAGPAKRGRTKRQATVKESDDSIDTAAASSLSSSSAPASKANKFATKEPKGWKITFDRIKEYRKHVTAAVDTMGCERLAEVGEHIPPEVSRFQTLMSLVLSSQTKDTVTSVVIWKLQKELKGGLTIKGVLDVSYDELNKKIGAVGFHNKKAGYMQQIAQICKDKYNGDIPSTVEGLVALPGVGPKMAHLTLQVAWKKTLGIGVDTHVHRISNRLGWVKTEKDGAEGTRMALESWLPKEHWREINVILVGFGQVLCLPRGPLCYTCPVQDRCPSATGIPNRKKIKTLIKDESDSPLGEVELHPVHIKTEAPDVAVKLEKDDGETSKYFSETLVPVKQEEEESSSMHDNVLDSTLVDSSRLKDENIDIEDLVP